MISERNWQILTRRKDGLSFKAIGVEFGISVARVRQIVERGLRAKLHPEDRTPEDDTTVISGLQVRTRNNSLVLTHDGRIEIGPDLSTDEVTQRAAEILAERYSRLHRNLEAKVRQLETNLAKAKRR